MRVDSISERSFEYVSVRATPFQTPAQFSL